MPNLRSLICHANGIDIHYWRSGSAQTPVILLHGLTGSGACWFDLARALDSEYDVLLPDARGHGLSSAPQTGYRYQDHADDLAGFIRALGLRPPVLVGHSMGGMTAALVASQKATPVRALILADPTFMDPERQHQLYESDAVEQHRQLLRSGESAVLTQLRSRHPQRSTDLIQRIAAARRQTRIETFDVLTPPAPDYRELVSTISVPMLLLTGDKGVLSLEAARELETLNPLFLQVAQIENAGHGLHYDQPNRFAKAVKSFLMSLRADR